MAKRINAIASAIRGQDDNIRRIREKQKKLRANKTKVLALIRRTQSKRFTPLGLCAWVSGPDTEYNDELKVSETIITIGISIHNLSGFKDPLFVELLGKFMDADRESTRDYAAAVNRDYFFWFRQPDADHWIKVAFYVYVRSDSPTCRKVLRRVETETVEKPIYEIVCD